LQGFPDWSFDAKVISNLLACRRNRFFDCDTGAGSIGPAGPGRENERLSIVFQDAPWRAGKAEAIRKSETTFCRIE
jgi:hypothetical protein